MPRINAPIATITTSGTHPGIVAALVVKVFTAAVALPSAATLVFALMFANTKKTTAKVITNVAIPIPSAPKRPPSRINLKNLVEDLAFFVYTFHNFTLLLGGIMNFNSLYPILFL